MKKRKFVAVLSGGQDSVTSTAIARLENEVVEGVFFDYGQMHGTSEYECACYWANKWGFPLTSFDVSGIFNQIPSSLISHGNHNESHPIDGSLPASFVPGRNLLFLTIAAQRAFVLGANGLVTGVCQTDFSGYPDCRDSTIKGIETAVNFGFGYGKETSDLLKWVLEGSPFEIFTPLMYKTKAETFALARGLNILHEIIEYTHTGYTGSRAKLYPWGWGPEEGVELDPASALRAKGFEEFLSGNF